MSDPRHLASRPSEITDFEGKVRALHEFLAVLSHDLRSPLNAAVTWIQVLRNEGTDAPTREQALSSLERVANLQARMLEDLLDFSRMLSGKLAIDVQDVDLVPIVRASVDLHLAAAEGKGVRLETAIEPARVPMRGDPARLLQLVSKVLSNAIKFTPQGRSVTVSLRRLADAAEVSVADQGEGISPERLPGIFDRFWQGDRGGGRRGGLGLGLAVARHLAELHGGTIEAESAGEGRGSTFRIRVKLEPARSVSKPGTSAAG